MTNKTLRQELFALQRHLQAHFDDPAFEARRLLQDSLDLDNNQFLNRLDDILNVCEAAKIESVLARRQKGEPLSKILGWREFYGRRFLVNHETLDPRPDSELLIDIALKHLGKGANVLDLGCGTGCLGLTLAAERPDLSLTLSDICPGALDVAQENALRLGVDANFILSDWFAHIKGPFQMILSNPPYIPLAECAYLKSAVRDYDPVLALNGGIDGLKAYRVLAQQAGACLTQKGQLLIEHGQEQQSVLNTLFTQKKWQKIEGFKDLGQKERALLLTQ